MAKILYVEDEETLSTIVKESLEMRGYDITHCMDGEAGFQAFIKQQPDICVLDIMLPKRDGFTLAKDIRKVNPNVPIIFLTARANTVDVVKGFELGGNDYLKKPFSMEELIVRIKALLRNSDESESATKTDELPIGVFTLVPNHQSLINGDAVKKLTHRESELLKILILNKNRVVQRDTILQALWGDDSFYNARSMDVFITKLRRYLKEDPSIELINVRGVGYKLVV